MDLSKLTALEIVGSDDNGYTVRNPATGEEWYEPKTPKAGTSESVPPKQDRKPDLKWSANDIVMIKRG